MLETLPKDLQIHILRFLNSRQFKLVNKSFYQLSKDPTYLKNRFLVIIKEIQQKFQESEYLVFFTLLKQYIFTDPSIENKEQLEERASEIIKQLFNEVTHKTKDYEEERIDSNEYGKQLKLFMTPITSILKALSQANGFLSAELKLRPTLENGTFYLINMYDIGSDDLNLNYWIIKQYIFNASLLYGFSVKGAMLDKVTFGENSQYVLEVLAEAETYNVEFENLKGHCFDGGEPELSSDAQNKLIDMFRELATLKKNNQKLSEKNSELESENKKLKKRTVESDQKLAESNNNNESLNSNNNNSDNENHAEKKQKITANNFN